jgi:plastocyanin
VKRGTLTSLLVAAWSVAAAAVAGDVTIELRDAAGKPVPDAVIHVLPSKGAAPPPAPHARALVDQVNKEFVPRVSIIQAGTEIHFPNSDNIRHSLYSFSPAKTFATKLYSGREAAPVLFDKSGLVVLGCNIHDKMVAWVYVVDTPWFAKSGADGTATIKGLPSGAYRLSAEQPENKLTLSDVELRVESAPLRQTVVLKAGA